MDMYFYLTLFILLTGNTLVSYLIIHFFGLNSWLAKLIVIVLVAILALSTLFSFVFVHKRDNLWGRIYYTVSASWMGILLSFGLASIASSLVFWGFKIFGVELPAWIFRSLLLMGTIFLTLRSFYNAYKIKIKKYVVGIKNLPPTWEHKRIIHISDIHLGPILREDFFHRVIKQVKELNPDAVFITGDLFDGAESDFSWVTAPLNDLNAPLGLYYSMGNHDFILGAERVMGLLEGQNITVLSNRMVEREGLQIIGLDFTPDRNFDLKRAVLAHTGYSAVKPSILLFHEPKETVKSEGVGIDLQLSGHTHGGQMFPFNFLARYFYHNHSHGIYRRHDYTLSVTAGVGTWGPPMRSGSNSEIVVLTLRKK
ncbi:MAG: metallophosphoesterase [Candidatus Falkowbacteria bacterium]